ncbi:MAG: rubredoxin [Planctomycetes bacterium]|nr:rubredoxin [Planctomycetota bacterium]
MIILGLKSCRKAPAEGHENSIRQEPGTPWDAVPEDFICPECGVSKEDFEMIEVG